MRRETIAVDVDDVLAASAQEFVSFSNASYDTELTVEDYSEHWQNIWEVDHDEVARRASKFHTPERLLSHALINEADTAIRSLAQRFDLYITTARPQMHIEASLQWIDRHFGGLFKDVHFVPVWLTETPVTKAEVCREIGADYLIDDMPTHCNLAAEVGIQAVLFGDYSWNRTAEIHANVTRADSWPRVLEYFGVDTN